MTKPGILSTKRDLLSTIAKNYNTLQYSPQLKGWLDLIYPKRNFSRLTKFQLHKSLNAALIKAYSGEFQYKYSLFKKFQSQRLVAGFEIKVNNSRVDFLTINGCTTSFEIKSTIDNLAKLSKQAVDYLSAFEYNNVIVDEKHISNCITKLPASFGIIVYKDERQRVIRKPSLNTEINPERQLQLLSKKELFDQFSITNEISIIKIFSAHTINEKFKMALKKRYYNRWKFIVKNSNKILPIDLQFFFNTNISPDSIYR